MSDLEQHLGDALTDGKITDDDADAVRVFRDFLQDTPAKLTTTPAAQWSAMFEGRSLTYVQWRTKWLPYLVGYTTGPCTPDEWPAYRARLLDERNDER